MDSRGREVLLRGVNVNSLAEYWRGGSFRTVFPLARRDPGRMAAIGWNAVRLLVSWSRVEPRARPLRPQVSRSAWPATVRRLSRHGIYTIVDLHQDAWGPSLAARRARSASRPRSRPSAGTARPLGDPRRRRGALLPAGHARAEPGGQGRLAGLLHGRGGTRGSGHPDALRADAAARGSALRPLRRRGGLRPHERAQRDRRRPADGPVRLLRARARSDPRRRAGRAAGGATSCCSSPPCSGRRSGTAPRPTSTATATWSTRRTSTRAGSPNGPITRAAFATARLEARGFGGAPVLSGEWGTDPRRAGKPDRYFVRHQALQDAFRVSATLWTWRESCGDPHKVADMRAGRRGAAGLGGLPGRLPDQPDHAPAPRADQGPHAGVRARRPGSPREHPLHVHGSAGGVRAGAAPRTGRSWPSCPLSRPSPAGGRDQYLPANCVSVRGLPAHPHARAARAEAGPRARQVALRGRAPQRRPVVPQGGVQAVVRRYPPFASTDRLIDTGAPIPWQ